MNLASEPTGNLEVALAHAAQLLQSDPELAAEQAGEIVRAVGNHPQAVLLLARARRRCGETEDAARILETLSSEQPRWAAAHLERGLALGQLGRGEDAIEALQRALALKPDLPDAWRLLADHLQASGDVDAADRARANHVRASTRDPRLLQAASALCDNRIAEAEQRLREHLKAAPTDVAAIRMLAEVAARLGRYDDAQRLLERVLELAPGFHAARQNYALVLQRANQPEAALAEVSKLLAIEPQNPGYRNLLAILSSHVGDYDQAITLFSELLRQYPRSSRIWLSQGHALKTAGRIEESVQAYRRCIALDPGFGEAWWSLANLKTLRFDDSDIDAMRRALARDDLADEHRLHFEFALGKALEDQQQYADSFQHYASGNRLRRAAIPYDAAATTARVNRSIELLTPDFLAARTGFGCEAPDPVFIVGLPRSGSTLIEQILSSHSAVEGTMELPEMGAISRELRERAAGNGEHGYHELLAGMDRDELRALGEQYLERTRIHRRSDAPLFIDKMPNNFMHAGLIHLMLPRARIIDARRHPLACCFSNFKQHFARGQHFSYELGEIGRYYSDYVRLMAHIDKVLPGRVHRVIYEQMVEDTETQIRRLLDYCGLPFEDACLRFFDNRRPVRTASSEQVRQPIYRDGIEQWRHYEPWLHPLEQSLGAVLDCYPDAPDFAAGITTAR
jgi:tetratricopeptide (TPR) repeat protein